MVNGGLRKFAVFADDKLHVLVHHVSDVGDDRAHQNIDFKQDIEKYIKTYFHVDIVNFSFYSGSVESDIPVGQIFQKLDERRNHIVQLVFSLFFSYISYKILKGRLNPFVSHIVLVQ